MAQQTNSHLNRNIGIAVVLILLMVMALIAGLYYGGIFNTGSNTSQVPLITPSPTPTPIPLNFSISAGSLTIIQGESTVDAVTVQLNSEPNGFIPAVSLSVNSGTSGIQCSLDTPSGSPTFYSNVEISVPDSTPTGVYPIIVSGTGGGTTQSGAFTISVLSAQVYVSGTVTTTGLGTSPSQIQFVDQQTGLTYTGTLSGTSCSITLQNEHTYTVTVTWKGLLYTTGTYSGGSLYVYAPVGYTTQAQNYSG